MKTAKLILPINQLGISQKLTHWRYRNNITLNILLLHKHYYFKGKPQRTPSRKPLL